MRFGLACGWRDTPGGSKWTAREEIQLLDVLHSTYHPTYMYNDATIREGEVGQVKRRVGGRVSLNLNLLDLLLYALLLILFPACVCGPPPRGCCRRVNARLPTDRDRETTTDNNGGWTGNAGKLDCGGKQKSC